MPSVMVKILHRECVKRWPDRGGAEGNAPSDDFSRVPNQARGLQDVESKNTSALYNNSW